MPDPDTARIREEAIAWHLRLADASDEQWATFARWLEVDPRHNAAYNAVVDDDAYLDGALAQVGTGPVAANDDKPVVRRGWDGSIRRWVALAATVVLVAGLGVLLLAIRPDRYEIATAAGESRTVSLEGGSSIALNGDTRIGLDRNDPRFAEVLSGEARFEVVHDVENPFTVVTGPHHIVDAGTVFNLALDEDTLTLEVSEGAVRYEGGGQILDLDAGKTLTVAPGADPALGEQRPETMAGWMRGELVYRGTKLGKVGRDLHRATGVPITVSPDIAGRSFSGVIQTKGTPGELRDRVGNLLGLRVTETGDGWTIEP